MQAAAAAEGLQPWPSVDKLKKRLVALLDALVSAASGKAQRKPGRPAGSAPAANALPLASAKLPAAPKAPKSEGAKAEGGKAALAKAGGKAGSGSPTPGSSQKRTREMAAASPLGKAGKAEASGAENGRRVGEPAALRAGRERGCCRRWPQRLVESADGRVGWVPVRRRSRLAGRRSLPHTHVEVVRRSQRPWYGRALRLDQRPWFIS